MGKNTYTVNGWKCIPVSTEVEAKTSEEAEERGLEDLADEHGEENLEIDEIVRT